MKKVMLLVSCLFLASNIQVSAQSWLKRISDGVKEKATEKVEQRIEDKTDKATDKVLDKSEEALKKSGQKQEKKTTDLQTSKNENSETSLQISSKADVSYAKYDFIPGNEVIFDDDLEGELKGEFPSKWDLVEGNAEIAQINGENTLAIVGYTYITPLFKDKSFKLPNEFTIEFDLFIDEKEGENSLEFLNASDEVIANSLFWKDNTRFIFNWNKNAEEKTSEDNFDNTPGWHHYALSFNKRAMKVYMDAKRVANIPNMAEKPVKVKFFARGPEDNSTFHT